jgi:outer membrane lipase/esterase
MSKLPQFAIVAVLLALSTLNAPGAARAAGFDQFVAFGDSTLDTGYFRYHTSGNTQFDNGIDIARQFGANGGWAGNGVMNTTILAGEFGLSAAPVDNGGTNYANGGATTVNNTGAAVPDNICTILQIQNYLSAVNGVANPNALYLIKTGDNDATYVTNQGQTWIEQNPTYLSNIASQLANEVATLQAAGARTIVVRNSYDSALFAGPGGGIAPENQAAYARSYGLGLDEWSDLQADGVHFIPADNDSLFSFVAHHPTVFGFTPDSVLATNAIFYNPHIPAIMDILTPYQQQHYLFIDGIHLTTAGQTIEADYTYSLLTAPSEISLLAESVLQGGWARAATIQGQLDPCRQHRDCDGINFWTSSGGYSLENRNAPGFAGDSGAAYGGTVGMDYKLADGFLAGSAFTAGSQRPEFSTGGHFDETDEAMSLYAAYVSGSWWGNAVLSYDLFQDNVARDVQLGIYTDENNANTSGQSLALALRGGRDFTFGRFTTGPVAGLVVQQVHVDGFTESGATGVTALAFGNQTQDSVVSQLGWRVWTDLDRWRPFAEMDWDHEWAGSGRTVTATLTSFSSPYYTPTYTMDAAPVAYDWATLSLGTYYRLNSRVVLRGAASAMFINPQMATVGGELGLNFCF